MNRGIVTGLVLAVIQAGIVAGLGVKAAAGRESLPRAWVKVRPTDAGRAPTGRYLRLWLEPVVEVDTAEPVRVTLSVRDGRVIARIARGTGVRLLRLRNERALPAVLTPAVEHYVPPSGGDLARLASKELWMEVGVPVRGIPRPLRLGVMTGGRIASLGY